MTIHIPGIITCTRRFSVDAAHRVLEHESKCKHLHGHDFKIEVTCQSPKLDNLGRVIDFGQIKEVLGKWLDNNWDHNIILNKDDPLLKVAPSSVDIWLGKKPYVLSHSYACNPTSENLAEHFCLVANQLLNWMHIWISHVRVWETDNCFADFYPRLEDDDWIGICGEARNEKTQQELRKV